MKKNILLVEYDNSTIETIKEILSNPIFDITFADEGKLAKELLSKKEFDLMISAAMLPKFHGFNLSLYVSSNYPDTRVIIISGVYKGIEYKHQAVTQYKADDYFEKPLNKKNFYSRILELLEITEDDLKEGTDISETTEKVSDTKKIPTIKKIEKDAKKLTSEDIFGDIIEKVEKIPPIEIKIDEKKEEEPKEQTPKIEKEVVEEKSKEAEASQDKKKLVKVEIIDKSKDKAKGDELIKKIDDDIKGLVKPEKKMDKSKKFKKIEDEISKKFEETLSGLGLSDKKKAAKEETKVEEEEIVEMDEKEVVKAEDLIVEAKVKESKKEKESGTT